jgi:cytochrome P450
MASQPGFESDLISAAFFANPYPVFHRLRDEAPVYWSEAWQAWVLTRYADVRTMLRDVEHFSNVGRQAKLLEQLPAEARRRLHPLEQHYTRGGFSNLDPPEHTRLRALINLAFTPRMVEQLREPIQALVDELLDQLPTVDRMDLIADFAYPLPALVIAQLLGLPPEDRDQFKHWSDDVTRFLGTAQAVAEIALEGQASLQAMRAYLGEQAAQRRRQPGNDLISRLLQAADHGQGLTEGELLGTCVTLLQAGHETTTNLIGNGVLALLRQPEQWAALDQASVLMGAVEELLRYDAPAQRAWRVVAQAVEIDGRRLEAGQSVYGMLGAANRDPAQFPDPDRVDVHRHAGQHLAFGYGIHFCLGAPLARLEAALALHALRHRWPQMHLASGFEPAWYPNMAFRGLRSLLVELC